MGFYDVLMLTATLDNHYYLSLDHHSLSLDHHYSLSLFRIVLYRGAMHEWYRCQLSTTTYLFCMARTLFIDVSYAVNDNLFILQAVNNNLFILHGTDFIYWRFIWWPQPLIITTLSLYLLRIVLLSWCDARTISLSAVNNNIFILHCIDFILWMFHYWDCNPWPSLLSLYLLRIVLLCTNDIDISCQLQYIYFACHGLQLLAFYFWPQRWSSPLSLYLLRSINVVGWTNDIDISCQLTYFARQGLHSITLAVLLSYRIDIQRTLLYLTVLLWMHLSINQRNHPNLGHVWSM